MRKFVSYFNLVGLLLLTLWTAVKQWDYIPDSKLDPSLETLTGMYLFPRWFRKLYERNLVRRRELAIAREQTLERIAARILLLRH
jgi:hypothetical protein